MITASHPSQSSLQDTSTLVQAFLDNGRNRGLSKYTMKWYSGILTVFVKRYPELPTDPEPIEAYIGSYITGDERRHGVFRALRAFYNFTCARMEINNPFETIKPPQVKSKAKKALTIEEVNQLLTHPGHVELLRALLYLLVDTGIRAGEAVGITAKDVGPNSVKVTGKTGERFVPISPQVHEMLVKIMPPSTYQDQRLFPHETSWISHNVSRALVAAGLQGFNCHSLRHTFCTLWNGSDTALKHITGHSSWRMIEVYKHNRDAQAQEQHKVHSPLAKLFPQDIATKTDTTTSTPLAAPIQQGNLDIVIKLAGELGAAKERIKQLEAELLLCQVKGV